MQRRKQGVEHTAEKKHQRNAKMQFKSTNENVTAKGSYALFLAVSNALLSA